MMGFSAAAFAQNPPDENGSPDDSACVRRSTAIIYKIKKSGQKPLYHPDTALFAALYGTDTVSRKQKGSLLNIGGDKTLSLSIGAIHVNSYDSTGSITLMKIEQEMPLAKDIPIPHCESIGMDLKGFGLPGSVKNEILYAKIGLSWRVSTR